MRRFAWLTVAVVLAACAGGGGTHATVPVSRAQQLVQTAPVTMVLVIPKTSSAAHRAPRWVTAATASIRLQVTAVKQPGTGTDITSTVPAAQLAPQIAPISTAAGNPNTPGQCGTDPANAQNVKCTATFQVPVGDASVIVAAYDGPGATGNVISQATSVLSVFQDRANTFAVTLDANPRTIAVTPASAALVGAGNGPFTVYATNDVTANIAVSDAHGTPIPPGAPGGPVLSASSSDASVLTASATGNTLTIHPIAAGGHATVTVTATPASAGDGLSAAASTFTVTMAAPTGTLFVGSASLIRVYPAGASGSVTPQREITGFYSHSSGIPPPCGVGCYTNTLGPIGAGANGTVLALHLYGTHLQPPFPQLEVYGPTANGPAIPQATYNAGSWPVTEIATTAGGAGYDIGMGGSKVLEYPGNGPWTQSFDTGYASGLGGLAICPSGQLFVSVPNQNLIAVYPPNPSGAQAPLRTFTAGPNPDTLACGPDGTLYVAVHVTSFGPPPTTTDSIAEFAAGASSPLRTLGPLVRNGRLVGIAGMALDAENELYVGLNDSGSNSISVFLPGAGDASAPVRTLLNPIPPTSPGGGVYSIAIGT